MDLWVHKAGDSVILGEGTEPHGTGHTPLPNMATGRGLSDIDRGARPAGKEEGDASHTGEPLPEQGVGPV